MNVAVVKAGAESAHPIELVTVQEAILRVVSGQWKFLGQDMIPAEILNDALFNTNPPPKDPPEKLIE